MLITEDVLGSQRSVGGGRRHPSHGTQEIRTHGQPQGSDAQWKVAKAGILGGPTPTLEFGEAYLTGPRSGLVFLTLSPVSFQWRASWMWCERQPLSFPGFPHAVEVLPPPHVLHPALCPASGLLRSQIGPTLIVLTRACQWSPSPSNRWLLRRQSHS